MTDTWNAELYGDKYAFVWKLDFSVIELLAPQPRERILDLGCGTGQLTGQIAQSGAAVVGLDNSPVMIDEARRLHPQLEFREADAQEFDVPEPVDAVFSNAALRWITKPTSLVGCIAWVFKPIGRRVWLEPRKAMEHDSQRWAVSEMVERCKRDGLQ